jgi:hypothetical protein
MTKIGIAEGNTYMVGNNAIKACIDLMDREYFKRNPFSDFNKFGLTLERLDGRDWNHAENLLEYASDVDPRRVASALLGQRGHVDVYLSVRYLLHSVGGAAAIAVQAPIAAAQQQGL